MRLSLSYKATYNVYVGNSSSLAATNSHYCRGHRPELPASQLVFLEILTAFMKIFISPLSADIDTTIRHAFDAISSAEPFIRLAFQPTGQLANTQ